MNSKSKKSLNASYYKQTVNEVRRLLFSLSRWGGWENFLWGESAQKICSNKDNLLNMRPGGLDFT